MPVEDVERAAAATETAVAVATAKAAAVVAAEAVLVGRQGSRRERVHESSDLRGAETPQLRGTYIRYDQIRSDQ